MANVSGVFTPTESRETLPPPEDGFLNIGGNLQQEDFSTFIDDIAAFAHAHLLLFHFSDSTETEVNFRERRDRQRQFQPLFIIIMISKQISFA